MPLPMIMNGSHPVSPSEVYPRGRNWASRKLISHSHLGQMLQKDTMVNHIKCCWEIQDDYRLTIPPPPVHCPLEVISQGTQGSFSPIAWPETWLKWIELICFTLELQGHCILKIIIFDQLLYSHCKFIPGKPLSHFGVSLHISLQCVYSMGHSTSYGSQYGTWSSGFRSMVWVVVHGIWTIKWRWNIIVIWNYY